MVGGKAHDDALNAAIQEGMQRFHQCSRRGKWVCAEVCWNGQVGQCEEYAPNFKEEFASAHAHAKADAARAQLQEKAQATNYVGNADMSEGGYSAAPNRPTAGAGGDACAGCGVSVGAAKFCPLQHPPRVIGMQRVRHRDATRLEILPQLRGPHLGGLGQVPQKRVTIAFAPLEKSLAPRAQGQRRRRRRGHRRTWPRLRRACRRCRRRSAGTG
jgi:hypothetical protein